MENLTGNVEITPRGLYTPRSYRELRRIVSHAKRDGRKIRAVGSRWSFSDCWVAEDYLIDFRNLDKIFAFSQGREVWGHVDPGSSESTSTRPDESRVLVEGLKQGIINSSRRFAHIEAGIKISELIDALDNNYRSFFPPFGTRISKDIKTYEGQRDRESWALPTMGGATGQTLAGAISTGTHGGDFNLAPIADMVKAIHIIAADGTPLWIEPEGSKSITDRRKMERLNIVRHTDIHYDDDLFQAALVSVGNLGVIYSYIIEVREQFGLSEKVYPLGGRWTWNRIKPHLESGDIFTGTRGIPWLNDHSNTLSNGNRVGRKIPKGVGVFINPYRNNKADLSYTGSNPDRDIMLVTHAEADRGYDDARPRGEESVSNPDLNAMVVAFEAAKAPDVLHNLVGEVLKGLRNPDQARGYPKAYSILNTTSNDEMAKMVLSFEFVVSTAENRHTRLIDRILEMFDRYIRGGNKFAGGIALRFTQPTSATLGMQTPSGLANNERFCHIEFILLKELAANFFFGNPPHIHKGDHNMEENTERAMRDFERAAAEFGARMHWGQLNQLNRSKVEGAYTDSFHKWRMAATRFAEYGDKKTFSNWLSRRCGLFSNSEVMAATSWGTNRYDIFTYDEKGDVLQFWWNGRWHWSNLGNRFPNNDRFVGPLTATSWGNNRIDVFGLGKNGDILQLWWQGGWHWSNLSKYFGHNLPLNGCLAATSPSSAHIEIFGIAKGGDVWRFWFKNGWHRQNLGNSFPNGERFCGSITAVSWGPNRVDVFGQGTKGQVLQLHRQGNENARWNWTDMSTRYFPTNTVRLAGPITGVSTGPNRIDLFALAHTGNIWRLYWNNGWRRELINPNFPGREVKFGMPHEFGREPRSVHDYYKYQLSENAEQNFVGPLTAVSWGGRRLDIFGFDQKDNVLQMWRSNDNQRWVWSDKGNRWNDDMVVERLLVDLEVGDDDIRDDSRGQAYIRLRGGRVISGTLYRNRERPERSRFSVSMNLNPRPRLGDIEAFGIKHTAGGNNWNADNWNMNMVKVTYISSAKSDELLYRRGNPVWRFEKNSHQVWETRDLR